MSRSTSRPTTVPSTARPSGVSTTAVRDETTCALVFAVGHPLGVKDAVSVGVFQAVGAIPLGFGMAERRPRRGRSPFIPWVQADVRLAPGNSGGPIADVEGNVIGVAAMIVSGLALAVPAPDLERLLTQS